MESTGRVEVLSGLRGIAVLLVLLSHVGGVFQLPVGAGIGKAGVFLFFTLSAYLLTSQILSAFNHQQITPAYWGTYLVRRVMRIYPLYLLVLLVSALGYAWFGRYFVAIEPFDVVRHLVLLDGKSVFWTIPVEFSYYLLLPFIAIPLGFAQRYGNIWAIALGVFAIGLSSWAWPQSESALNGINVLPYLPIFLMGSLAPIVIEMMRQHYSRSSRLGGIGFILTIMAVAVTVPDLWRLLVNAEITNSHFHRDYLMYGILWSLCLVFALVDDGVIRRFLEWKPLTYLGLISFSAYLVHLPIFLFFNSLAFPAVLSASLAFALTLSISAATYRFIEAPAISLGKSLSRKITSD